MRPRADAELVFEVDGADGAYIVRWGEEQNELAKRLGRAARDATGTHDGAVARQYVSTDAPPGFDHAARARVRVDAAVRSPQTRAAKHMKPAAAEAAAAGLACSMPGTLLRFEAEPGPRSRQEPLAVVAR